MKLRLSILLLSACGLLFFAACAANAGGRVIGGQPIAIGELPTYPGAVELNAGESKIIEPIFGPAQRETPPFIGLGIEVVKTQRNFRVPQETRFNQVKEFYADKLQAGGWREDAAMRVFINNANEQIENVQGAIWVRVDQTLLLVMATDPSNGEKEVTLSLATH